METARMACSWRQKFGYGKLRFRPNFGFSFTGPSIRTFQHGPPSFLAPYTMLNCTPGPCSLILVARLVPVQMREQRRAQKHLTIRGRGTGPRAAAGSGIGWGPRRLGTTGRGGSATPIRRAEWPGARAYTSARESSCAPARCGGDARERRNNRTVPWRGGDGSSLSVHMIYGIRH